jgi:hypothetical protein
VSRTRLLTLDGFLIVWTRGKSVRESARTRTKATLPISTKRYATPRKCLVGLVFLANDFAVTTLEQALQQEGELPACSARGPRYSLRVACSTAQSLLRCSYERYSGCIRTWYCSVK